LSYYSEDEAKSVVSHKLDSLRSAKDSSMRRYWGVYNKLKEIFGLDEILDNLCATRKSTMYNNWCKSGAYFLTDDDIRRELKSMKSFICAEEERINRPSYAKRF
jgi:spore coat protein CotH